MKHILFTLVGLAAAIGIYAQSVEIVHPMELIENSSAIVQFKNYFGQYENPNVDKYFPYSVLQMDLKGDPNDIKNAKEHIQLYMGSQKMTEETITDEQNRIIFLLPEGVKNIQLQCGDGCEPQSLWKDRTLRLNAVYACQIQYFAPKDSTEKRELLKELEHTKAETAQKDSVIAQNEALIAQQNVEIAQQKAQMELIKKQKAEKAAKVQRTKAILKPRFGIETGLDYNNHYRNTNVPDVSSGKIANSSPLGMHFGINMEVDFTDGPHIPGLVIGLNYQWCKTDSMDYDNIYTNNLIEKEYRPTYSKYTSHTLLVPVRFQYKYSKSDIFGISLFTGPQGRFLIADDNKNDKDNRRPIWDVSWGIGCGCGLGPIYLNISYDIGLCNLLSPNASKAYKDSGYNMKVRQDCLELSIGWKFGGKKE